MDARVESLSRCTVQDADGNAHAFSDHLEEGPLLLVVIRHFG